MSTRLVTCSGMVYRMTSRQWLKYATACRKGERPDIPGSVLGMSINVTDADWADFEDHLTTLCERCGTDLPHDAEKRATDNGHCECGNPLAHSVRRNKLFAKRRKESGGGPP